MTDGQIRAFERWWPEYGLSLFDGLIDQETLFGRKAPLVVEVGFGMGESLVAMALNEPDKDFIGIEVHPPGVGRLINSAGEAGVKNLRVYMADAKDVLEDCIPDSGINRMQLYFPDPWHKKKHHKRRIVQPEFAQHLRQKIAIGGIFHMATDWEPYAEHMMEVMTLAEGYCNHQGEYVFAEKPDYRPNTKFEQRGERLGHGVWDLLFERVD
ncbi:tRNA (guanosine(46)-N7)-methyltransferase TrmB [Marinibactrum halimedae]|nr:tRNA (guanosine(46)-N7)-methyltransferase TrmB [Marinibactrum halimedae]MCD9458241.1 tRNA (guanosine(46)-N7)-methyltransferase TrmB [Marinibactrum halimedae]